MLSKEMTARLGLQIIPGDEYSLDVLAEKELVFTACMSL